MTQIINPFDITALTLPMDIVMIIRKDATDLRKKEEEEKAAYRLLKLKELKDNFVMKPRMVFHKYYKVKNDPVLKSARHYGNKGTYYKILKIRDGRRKNEKVVELKKTVYNWTTKKTIKIEYALCQRIIC